VGASDGEATGGGKETCALAPPAPEKKRGRVGRRVGRIHRIENGVEIHKKENRTGCRYEQWRIRVYVDMATFTEIGTRKM